MESHGKRKTEWNIELVIVKQYFQTGGMEITICYNVKNMGSRIGIKIDWDGHNHAPCTENEDIAGIATGKTLEAVKADMIDALRKLLDWTKENGEPGTLQPQNAKRPEEIRSLS